MCSMMDSNDKLNLRKKSSSAAKKKKKGDDEEYDKAVDTAGSTMDADDVEVEATAEDKLREAVSLISDKKPGNRIAGLKIIQVQLSNSYMPEFLTGRLVTVIENLVQCVKKGKEEEVELACSCLMLIAITAGDECDAVLEAASSVLQFIMKDPSADAPVRAAVSKALGVLTFLTADDVAAIALVETMGQQISVLSKGKGNTEDALAQLLDSWGLAATLISKEKLAGALNLQYMAVFVALLEHSNLNVRLAAGENVALLCEASDAAEEVEHGRESKSKGEVAREHLIEVISELATEATKQKAKKEKAVQRATFREILETVENGTLPSESVRVGKTKYEVDGWAALKQLRALRDVLGSGMQSHLITNAFLHEILGFDGPDGQGVNEEDARLEGKLASRANSRALHDHKTKERQRKAGRAFGNDEE